MIILDLDPQYRPFIARLNHEIHREKQQLRGDVEPLVDESPGLLSRDLPPNQVQGLLNAIAAGPGLMSPSERLLSLAEYLARSQARSPDGQRWHCLAEILRDRISDLEDTARDIVSAADHGTGPPHAVQESLIGQVHIHLIEIFLDLLVGYYAARRQASQEETS